jgi:single-stranded-DNA-specific exonuclease
VTVDSGINEIDAVDFFNRHNIDTVVLDHHIIYQRLPRAVAVVNPKRKDCPPEGNLPRHDKFPFNMLAGVGVVYNVIKIIEQFKKIPPNNLYPALVGLGTIADRMPLIDDNRIFAKFTFENILDSENLFISFFVEHNKNLSRSKMIDLLIKLLTMGRDRDGLHLGVEALLANRLSEVKEEYDILQTRLEKNIKEFGKVNEFIEAKFNEGLALGVNGKESEDIFIYCDKKGYIPIKFLGKAASYLFDKYKIPTLILTRQGNNVLSAESRGPENFDWLDSFGKISEHLIQYGGHKRAAGFTCYDREFEKIRDKLIQIAKANSDMHQAEHSKKGEIKIDYQIAKENLNVKGLEGIFNLFSPFGEGNKLPIFLVDNISCCELKSLGIDNIPQIKEEEKVDALISFNNRKQKALRILDYEIRD